MEQYRAMFEQAIESLATIDYALGIGDDGCNDLEGTLHKIAELKGEAEVRALPVIDSPLQKLGTQLANLLDEDQFNSLEQYLLAAHRENEELRERTCGVAVARVNDADDFSAEVVWILNPLPAGTLLYEGPNAPLEAGAEAAERRCSGSPRSGC